MNKLNMETLKITVVSVIERSKKDKRILIAAAAVVILIVAVLFFVLNGKNDNLIVTSPDGPAQVADSQETAVSAKPIYVDISGEVKNQGVYQVADGTRLFEVIEKAGGLTAKASIESINQAEIVTDGQKIIVPNKDDFATYGADNGKQNKGLMDNGLVNINIADSTVLQEIPGVGPATAEKIISYRNSNGSFKKIEDLMNVSGIGQKTFDKIKDMITV